MDFTFLIYLIFGILPSLTWLFYYLKKDKHPEKKSMILKIFLWGVLFTIPVLIVQLSLTQILNYLSLPNIFILLIYWFLVIAFVEEIFKYLVVKLRVLNSPEFDEPIDTMIYMIISALGFAAVENTIYLWPPIGTFANFNDIITRTTIITCIRFIGATFLHTLCSGTLGYFLALSFKETKSRQRLLILGILMAVGLHGLYNFSIMTVGQGLFKAIIPILILIILSIFVMHEFDKLKKIKSICKTYAKKNKINNR